MQERSSLNLRFFGCAPAIFVLISLALPWWTLNKTNTYTIANLSVISETVVDEYLYKTTLSSTSRSLEGMYMARTSSSISIIQWYGWLAIMLAITGALLGFAGCIGKHQRILLLASGVGAAFSLVVLSLGSVPDRASAGYMPYPTFDFWLVLIAVALMVFASTRMHNNAVQSLQSTTY